MKNYANNLLRSHLRGREEEYHITWDLDRL